MNLSQTDVMLAADTLRNFELLAADYPSTKYDFTDRGPKDATYYRVSKYRREGGLPAADLYALLTEPTPGFSASGAKAVVREAVTFGNLLRLGGGSATYYRTPARQTELDDAAQVLSDQQLALGERAESLGLTVAYTMNNSYSRTVTGSQAAREQLAHGRLVTRATLQMNLTDVADLLAARA